MVAAMPLMTSTRGPEPKSMEFGVQKASPRRNLASRRQCIDQWAPDMIAGTAGPHGVGKDPLHALQIRDPRANLRQMQGRDFAGIVT